MDSANGFDMYRGYETIEQDWDRFYREYPYRYDRFAVSSIHAVHELQAMFGFTGAIHGGVIAGHLPEYPLELLESFDWI